MIIKRTLFIVVLLCCIQLLSAQVYYVKVGSTGTGTSWSDASGDLSQILENATAGSEVWVGTGIYYPVQCGSCTDLERDLSFEIPDSVSVYGGFVGTELAREERDWIANETIFSGDIDQDSQPLNNSKTIVHFTRVSVLTILDGFSIVDGYAHSPGDPTAERENSGAAIFNQGGLAGSNSHPTIRNCNFQNNSALGFGGAIYNNGGFGGNASPIIVNCNFQNNTCELGGGAVFNQANFSGVALTIFTDCTFLNNAANQNSGGGVYNQAAENGDCSPTFTNCLFEGNTTNDYGGGVHSHGRKGKSNSVFTNCMFINNEANFGGGVSNNGTLNGESNATFTNCDFESNHVTGDGGGVFNWGSDNGMSNAIFLDCLFRNNNSDFAGAGMFNNGINGECSATITNCRFIENTATTYGGAVYNNGKKGNASAIITNSLFQCNSGNSAGAVYNLGSENGNSSPKITNCTFYGNTANVGGAVYNNASDSTGTSSPIITNCVFWKNEANFGNVFRNILGTPFIQYSVVDESDCNSMNSGIGSNVSCGDGMLFNIYPEFEDTLNNDFRLKLDSPVLDIGDNTTIDTLDIDFDLDHQNRIFNAIVDFGAYEYFDSIIPPLITGQPQDTIICEGEMLVLNISVAGTPPLNYQWSRNGVEINNATNSSFIINIATTDDSGEYTCKITNSFGGLVVSDSALVLVNPIQVPAILLEASAINICENEVVMYNVLLENEGVSPVITWYLNGNQFEENVNSVELNSLNDEDEIVVSLTSSLACAEPGIVYDTVQMQVTNLITTTIEIIGPDTIVCAGNEAKFESIYFNEGINPIFKWLKNGNEIPDQNEDVFTSVDLLNGDIIACEITSSLQCVYTNPVLSNPIVSQIDSCLVNALVVFEDDLFQINPNPSDGFFYISPYNQSGEYTINILDLSGHVLFNEHFSFINGNNLPLTIPKSGTYFIQILDKNSVYVQKIIVEKR
jgi:predicted outer membrane repeat protein